MLKQIVNIINEVREEYPIIGNELDGKIGRSLRFDTRNKDGKLGMVSIIIDAKKPIVMREK